MQPLSSQPYKGTRDFYPEDMQIRQWMFNCARSVLRSFGYQEYDGPILEPFELYAAKTSEEIVNEQLYSLIDRGDRKLALRPEMTPTLSRMVAAKQNELPKPIRWFSIPNLWRYERPQKGRLREHWQINVDVFGGNAFCQDLEICELIVALMDGFGAKDGYKIKLNHRGLTLHLFSEILKLPAQKIPVVGRLLDAALKMEKQAFTKALKEEGLDPAQVQTLLSILEPQDISKIFLNNPEYLYLQKILNGLKSLNIDSCFELDPAIMRGFMYYTGLVFEVYDLHPENNRAILGGGRYDNLVSLFGGAPLSGVGFGLGDVTLRNFLEVRGLIPQFKKPKNLFIASVTDGEFLAVQKLAKNFREKFKEFGKAVSVLTSLEAQRPKKSFQIAEKLDARAIIFVGPTENLRPEHVRDVHATESNANSTQYNEGAKQVFTMKDLVTGEQLQGNVDELAGFMIKACEQ